MLLRSISHFSQLSAVLVLLVSTVALASWPFVHASLNVGIDHDLTQPTYGLEGKSGSTIKYDNQNGFNLGGTISDLLGPPIKIANGFNNIIKGSNMASMGTGLKSGGALLGFDAKMLEAAGAGNLFKGSLVMNGLQAKHRGSTNELGQQQVVVSSGQTKVGAGGQQLVEQQTPNYGGIETKGQKIANIIEIPVKVVAMKDLMEGKALTALGQAKAAGANQISSKGQTMMSQGQALKAQGLNQMLQGASEGVQNIGSLFQRKSDNVQTAFKLLPLIWDMQTQDAAKGQQQVVQEPVQQQQQQQVIKQQERPVSMAYQMSSPTGGSLFGGLGSLMPGLNGGAGGFGSSGPNPSYAALWNTTSPLTNLLMNPSVNPFLLPLTTGPFGQAMVAKQPIGTPEASSANGLQSKGGLLTTGAGSQSYDFSLFPGVRYQETVSAALPKFGMNAKTGSSGAGGEVSKTTSHQQIVQQQQQQVAPPVPQQAQQIKEVPSKKDK